MCQGASSGTTDGRIISSMCMNSHPVSRLRAAKGLSRAAARCFAALSMTGLDLAVDAELSRAFEPCLRSNIRNHKLQLDKLSLLPYTTIKGNVALPANRRNDS